MLFAHPPIGAEGTPHPPEEQPPKSGVESTEAEKPDNNFLASSELHLGQVTSERLLNDL